ncbi:MAG: type II toxin-antitoxin system HicB family antitoxin [Selenomonadaceae bacterium]|nr:type II toxin-antitoxin system HicB family antitoxin [Selenomonadaceae bacterium]MBQ7628913.1 type II toxin-antitoxin system HicB family antitoxin [Selenomonadaceae bacterium]
MKYVYPAVFYRAIEGGYCINFPDVSGAITQADDIFTALEMAEDVLAGMLCAWEDYKAGLSKTPMANRIVDPTPIEEVVAEPDEFSTSAFVTLIKADTDAYRKMLAEQKASEKESIAKSA